MNTSNIARPHHEVVDALVRGTFVARLRAILDPGEWWFPSMTGFSWIPHRLRHDVQVLTFPDGNGQLVSICQSVVVLCTDVKDLLAALRWCHDINQRGTGASVSLDIRKRTIQAMSSVALDPDQWFAALLFEQTVPRQVGIFERLAPEVAVLVGGRVPDAEHPDRGRRPSPHALVTDVPPVADTVDPFAGDERFAQVDDVLHELVVGPDELWLGARVREVGQPDVGQGLELMLATVYAIGMPPEPEGSLRSSTEAMSVANRLNLLDQGWPSGLHLGGWTTWRNQLYFTAFVMPGPLVALRQLAGPAIDEVMDQLARMTFRHAALLAWARDEADLFAGVPPRLCPAWHRNDVSECADLQPVLVDDAPSVEPNPLVRASQHVAQAEEDDESDDDESDDDDRCASFHAGHHVHWVQAQRARNDRVNGRFEPCSVTSATDDGWFVLVLDETGEELPYWNHDPEQVRELVGVQGLRVNRYWSYLAQPWQPETSSVGRPMSIRATATPCVFTPPKGSPAEQLVSHGGFTIMPGDLDDPDALEALARSLADTDEE
jgi:hypothetical protein